MKTLKLKQYSAAAYRLTLSEEVPALYKKKIKINNTHDAARALAAMQTLAQERAVVMLLDNQLHLIGVVNLADGDFTSVNLDMRALFSSILISGADRVILAHNHPTSDAIPSVADVKATKDICKIANMIGVVVLDHVVLSRDNFQSMKTIRPKIFLA